MGVKCLLRHRLTCTCSRLHGVNINVTFLVGCTPNGAISFISPVYIGSISDVELTKVSGFLTAMKDKPGVSVMADKGFVVRDTLKEIDVDLNLPAFLNETQFTPDDIQKRPQDSITLYSR